MNKPFHFSPSPWIHTPETRDEYGAITSSDQRTVVMFAEGEAPTPEDLRLMLAAPELLSALREIFETWEDQFGRFQEAMGVDNPRLGFVNSAIQAGVALISDIETK